MFIKGIFNGEIMVKNLIFSDGVLMSQSVKGVKIGCMDNLQILKGVKPIETKSSNNALDIFQ